MSGLQETAKPGIGFCRTIWCMGHLLLHFFETTSGMARKPYHLGYPISYSCAVGWTDLGTSPCLHRIHLFCYYTTNAQPSKQSFVF